eukprot:1832403-Rhodomonas_salina.1
MINDDGNSLNLTEPQAEPSSVSESLAARSVSTTYYYVSDSEAASLYQLVTWATESVPGPGPSTRNLVTKFVISAHRG